MSDESTGERHLAGVWCHEVLERLPDLIDGEVDPAELARLQAHVAVCDWCERFGGVYGTLVQNLRDLRSRPPVGLAARLQQRLRQES